jgi:hypothetical protein
VATPAVQARVIRRVQQKPSDGSTHWSCRKLAVEMRLSKSTVQRILAQAKLKPHRLDRYLASNDPQFEAADIIGFVYEAAAARNGLLRRRESAIQALDRLDPVLRVRPVHRTTTAGIRRRDIDTAEDHVRTERTGVGAGL